MENAYSNSHTYANRYIYSNKDGRTKTGNANVNRYSYFHSNAHCYTRAPRSYCCASDKSGDEYTKTTYVYAVSNLYKIPDAYTNSYGNPYTNTNGYSNSSNLVPG